MANLGFCGRDCAHCLAFKATKKNDLHLLAHLSVEMETKYNSFFLPHRYRCTGCVTIGAKSLTCQECKIRNCALENKIISCEFCSDFPCDLHNVFNEEYAEYKHNTAQIKSR
ncbi:MAG: DUF3795 domain-containing protein [Synergistaceae bacterium]|nr:DUF3795 domain-containing protein [Synergistaceae bacterium]